MDAILEALPVLLNLWKSVLPLMFLGCFLGNLFLNTALMRHLGKVMSPLARLGNLPSGVDTPLTLCLVNNVAAYSMLAELKNNGLVNVREVVLSFLVSNIPKGLFYTVFYIAPVVLGALGMRLGLIYLLIYFGVFAVVGFVGLLLGRLLLSPQVAQVFKARLLLRYKYNPRGRRTARPSMVKVSRSMLGRVVDITTLMFLSRKSFTAS
jgi:hypothetical protein